MTSSVSTIFDILALTIPDIVRALAYEISEVIRGKPPKSTMPNPRDFQIVEQASVYQTTKTFNQSIIKYKACYFFSSDVLIR